MRITKTYVYNMCVGGFYQFKVFKVVDAAHQIWYIGEPVDRGATKVADTEEELRAILEAQVPMLNKYAEKKR